jgi:hypothetical protein
VDIAVALISAGATVFVGALSFLAVMISNNKANAKMQSEMNTAQAVTEERITELTREVREHNNFAHRMPVLEEQIKVINHRLDDLEVYHK